MTSGGPPPVSPLPPELEETKIVGRGSDCDVVVPQPMVSSRHARLRATGGRLIIEDLGSMNGVAVGDPHRRVEEAEIQPGDTVYLGSYPVAAAQLFEAVLGEPPRRQPPPPESPPAPSTDSPAPRSSVPLPSTGELLIGRDPGAGLTLDHPMVSHHHASITVEPGTGALRLRDLGSTNGTFVNGHRLTRPAILDAGDVVEIVGSSFSVSADRARLHRREIQGSLVLEAHDLAIDVPGRRLVEGVSFTLLPGELVGLMGSSGAGKTTLLTALNGYFLPAVGAVLYNQTDLYAHYARFRSGIGYVPQDDIMHGDLTVSEALAYTARLRLPDDMGPREIASRVDRVLGQLGLEDCRDVAIGSASRKGISGGQRRRVNLAMELLTEPAVLFLDEPTSGLSSEDALNVMTILRQLADRGKTVLLTIHQPSLEVFRLMDHLALLGKDPGGEEPARLVYFGPAYPDAIEFFEPPEKDGGGGDLSPDGVLRGLARRPVADWSERYEGSELKRRFVERRAGAGSATAGIDRQGAAPDGHSRWRQWATLVSRTLVLKRRDRWNSLILLVQAPVIAWLLVAAMGADSRRELVDPTYLQWQELAGVVATCLFLSVVASLWLGCSNAVREIVAEWPIYRRERMVNLRLMPYLCSKLTVLGGLVALQCGVLVVVLTVGCGLEGSAWELFALLWITALVGTVLGLAVSAIAPSSEVAISLVPLLLLPMVILGGVMQPAHRMGRASATLSQVMPSYWASQGSLVREAEHRPRAPDGFDRDLAEPYFPTSSRVEISAVLVVLGGMFVLLTIITVALLRWRDLQD